MKAFSYIFIGSTYNFTVKAQILDDYSKGTKRA